MGVVEMSQVAGFIIEVLRSKGAPEKLKLIAGEVKKLCDRFPVYPGLA
jgi:glycine/serine hydroxymethyltransferase